MEDDTPRLRESSSLTSAAGGLENMGAELLGSLVCPLPHAGLAPPGGRGLCSSSSSHPHLLLTSLLEHLGHPQCVDPLHTEQPR